MIIKYGKPKKPVGRPKAKDPKVHLPNVTIRESIIDGMAQVATQKDELSLSQHYEKACELYVLVNES